MLINLSFLQDLSNQKLAIHVIERRDTYSAKIQSPESSNLLRFATLWAVFKVYDVPEYEVDFIQARKNKTIVSALHVNMESGGFDAGHIDEFFDHFSNLVKMPVSYSIARRTTSSTSVNIYTCVACR